MAQNSENRNQSATDEQPALTEAPAEKVKPVEKPAAPEAELIRIKPGFNPDVPVAVMKHPTIASHHKAGRLTVRGDVKGKRPVAVFNLSGVTLEAEVPKNGN